MQTKILISLTENFTATIPFRSYFKVRHIAVYPNGLLVNKDTPIEKAYLENIDLNKILFICPCPSIMHNNVLIWLFGKGNNCLMVSITLRELMKILPAENFVQIHDSYIINKLYTTHINPHVCIYLSSIDIPFPIGRSYAKLVDSIFLPEKPILQKRSHHKKDNTGR